MGEIVKKIEENLNSMRPTVFLVGTIITKIKMIEMWLNVFFCGSNDVECRQHEGGRECVFEYIFLSAI